MNFRTNHPKPRALKYKHPVTIGLQCIKVSQGQTILWWMQTENYDRNTYRNNLLPTKRERQREIYQKNQTYLINE